MPINLTEDFKTVEDLRRGPDEVLEHVQQTGRPVVITIEGKPAAVMMTAGEYERLVHLLNMARLLMEAEENIRAGKTRPIEEFFNELLGEKRRAKKVSR